jgi:hypothetical protein
MLQELKVKPYTSPEGGVEPDWSEGWQTVPWEFVDYSFELLPILVKAAYEPRFATLKGWGRRDQNEIITELSRSALLIGDIKSGAVRTQAREAYRAQAWTKAARWLDHYVHVDEAIVLGLGDSLERAVSEASRCVSWFRDEDEYRRALLEVAPMRLSLLTAGQQDYDGDFPETFDVSGAFFCPPVRLRELLEAGRRRRDDYTERWKKRRAT